MKLPENPDDRFFRIGLSISPRNVCFDILPTLVKPLYDIYGQSLPPKTCHGQQHLSVAEGVYDHARTTKQSTITLLRAEHGAYYETASKNSQCHCNQKLLGSQSRRVKRCSLRSKYLWT